MIRSNIFSLSKSAVIACLLAVSALTITGVPTYEVKAANVDNNVQAADTLVKKGSDSNAFIFDSRFKNYKDLAKASRIAGVNFKVPDYTVEGYVADSGIDVIKQKDNTNFLSLRFSKLDENKNFFTYNIEIFKEDPIKLLTENNVKNYDELEVKDDISSQDKVIGSVKGKDITVTETYSEKSEVQSVLNDKYFSWEDNGVYYLFKYSSKADYKDEIYNTDIVNLNENDVEKIVNSMKKPQDISNVKYFSDSIWGEDCYYIYDKEDLENAYKALGFTPKYISNIDDSTEIKEAELIKSDNKKKFSLIYNYKEKDMEYGEYFEFNQTKDASDYNDMKNGGLNLYKFDKNYNKISKSEKIKIKNKDVYKIKEAVPEEYQNALGEYKYIYMWEDNGVYYSVESTFPEPSFDSVLENAIGEILDK